MSDPYENKALLGAMVRDAAKAAVHNTDGPSEPDLQRLNNILVCEAFVNALVDKGCMITRLPSQTMSGGKFDDNGGFIGHDTADWHEHRTVGPHRAWCLECREWCYPHDGCIRCKHPEG